MKKVVVVTIRNEIGKMYHEELSSIFYDCLDITSYRIETDHKYNTNSDYIKSADVILLTNLNIFSFIKNMVNEKHKILFLDCGFLKNKIESLKNYPDNTKALVCFNYYVVSVKAIATIHEMGVTNLALTAYNPDAPDLNEKYDLAIVGESSAIVPNNIETIISLGRRKVNFKTLMDLAIATDTLNDITENRIMNYSLEIASSSDFFDNTLSYESSIKTQLNTVMDFIDYSIIILNNNHVILNYNKNLLQMFDLRDTLLNKNIAEVPEIRKLAQHIDDENMINKLIEINENKRILITVRVLKDSLLKSNSYLILMRDVTDVMKLEGTLKKQMEKRGYTTKYNFLNIYGKGREIKDCVEKAKIFGKLDKNVLIVGESGTGKELFAHSMHDYSPRKNYPFIGINCAALPSTLLESELFGYEEGTFTGAKKGGKRGLFELANNGTLFLDEIGDMTIETQTKILRVLEEKEFMRLGSGEIISINVRIMAATNKDLRELINEGLFRLDLYYRLNTYMLKIPPLRNRKGDIEYLIRMFIEEESKTPVSIDEDAINFLVNCNWYGNVRELKNCIEYMVTISKGGPINMSHIPDYIMEEHEELNKHIFAPQGDVLYELNGREKDIAFLIMSEIFKTSCGRRKIYEVLRKTYPDLTEYKLRMIINILAEKNLIRQGTGRRGMSLTDKGLKYIGE